MKKYCFGIDVGGTTIKCGLFNTEGNVLDKWEIPTRLEANGSFILPDIAKTITEKLDERGLTKNEIEGIGLDIPGPVDEDGVCMLAVNLHWGKVNIVREMEKLTGIRTRAANDANAAALGECWKGGGAGHKNLIMVTLGTGIGGGVSKAGPVILYYVQKYYRQYAFPGCKDAAFALATLGNDAGIYGAAKLVL